MLRPIIEIDEEKCDGCGQCILDCAEGALKIVDGKAKLVSEVYCDGLGACLNCPRGALRLEMKEAPPFDEIAALAAKAKEEKKAAGTKILPMAGAKPAQGKKLDGNLRSWPLQLALVQPNAGYLRNADIVLAAHCSAFALPNVQDVLQGKIPIIACPKLEDAGRLVDRLAAILENNEIKSLTILRMSVPCCGGLERIANLAIEKAGSKLKPETIIVQI
ncbi:MAG: ferredoxin [Desulfovibrio sp.]|nr:ferredoxin [Desulfovibrio sp.]